MFAHILLPLDGSQFAETALPAAFEIAKRFHSKVTLISVVRPPYFVASSSGPGSPEMWVDLREQAIAEAQRYLEGHQHWLNYEGVQATVRVSEMEPVAEAILHVADEIEADIIIMSTHGRGGLSRWVYGSIADKVLRHASMPVLLIRSKDEDGEIVPVVAPESAEAKLPEEESADVLARKVAEEKKPSMVERLMDEHTVDRTSR